MSLKFRPVRRRPQHAVQLPPLIPAERARLWAKIKCAGPEECWLWQGAKTEGYGRVKVDGKALLAHRVIYSETFRAAMAPWLIVMHRCDNPGCCNPRHLILGTKKDNAADMARKGRNFQPKGEQNLEFVPSSVGPVVGTNS